MAQWLDNVLPNLISNDPLYGRKGDAVPIPKVGKRHVEGTDFRNLCFSQFGVAVPFSPHD
jgi:hypothetical protein